LRAADRARYGFAVFDRDLHPTLRFLLAALAFRKGEALAYADLRHDSGHTAKDPAGGQVESVADPALTREWRRDRRQAASPGIFCGFSCFRPFEIEWHRRHLDYGEAQSFQDLLLCRSLRLIGDGLHAAIAGSSRISV
jgi:hypothetical protein